MLIFAFFLSLSALFLQSVVFQGLALLPFAPWLAFLILKQKKALDLPRVLWLAFFAGILSDLFSEHPLGLHPICYCLASFLLFRFRSHFLYEKPLHLALFTTFISFTITQLELFFLFLFDRRVPITGKWVLSDWIGMPIADGLFALIWFAGPLFLFSKANRAWVLFWIKKNLSLPSP